ncbi:xanthine phosphoribosyltransferase [Buchnera aphidicola (Melanaphis sacchari)]|uniref:Xanthine phosphoribosyltransferase n=1 Tax=Buchnera aphidicola (Melanaphis sacchari) TaxID=2173854 RepID=A0A2U8DG97_9GAMM|nr:xanthine phosphoribosyltransferase [Buchnera aphidicola]AWH90531.1 xanthine phosphoribosyltransferase [Buchnera aphidicola (Melanaphis sacchari)]
MSEKYIVTWDMLQIHIRKLAHRLLKINSWHEIIAVSRGGLVPSAILSREMGIRCVDTICIASYNYNSLQKNRKIIKISKMGNTQNSIIIDDLVDTGGTAKIIRNLYPKAYFVTVFAKPMGQPLVDDYIIDVDQNIWIEQPWDMSISYTPPFFKQLK